MTDHVQVAFAAGVTTAVTVGWALALASIDLALAFMAIATLGFGLLGAALSQLRHGELRVVEQPTDDRTRP